MEEKKETQIDFVIAWVDGGDPAWQRERDRYGKMGEKTAVEETGEREKSGVACDTRDVRYRDWDCLRFWFRSVEQNAPWVHKGIIRSLRLCATRIIFRENFCRRLIPTQSSSIFTASPDCRNSLSILTTICFCCGR